MSADRRSARTGGPDAAAGPPTLGFGVDPEAGVPPYEQLRSQVASRAADGSLPVGTRLPPVRTLATALGLATGTVARAYKELEAAGVVETRGRAGTVVSASGDLTRARLARAADRFAEVAHDLGVPDDDALAVARAALERRG